jgi:ferredoxin
MTYVVTESCIKCKYTDCVDPCPVDAFREGPNMLVIDPDDCIDCDLCVPECPVNAIFRDKDVPTDQLQFTQLNSDLSRLWPLISRVQLAPSDADDWATVQAKQHLLQR